MAYAAMTNQRNAWMSTVADSVEGTDDVVDGAKPFNKAAKRPAIGATEKYRKYMKKRCIRTNGLYYIIMLKLVLHLLNAIICIKCYHSY